MRITQSMYYKNLYGTNNSQLNAKLFDVNKQISSGMSIQYAKDDVRIFSDTMRLDNEMTTLGQMKKSSETGYKLSNQTDIVLNEFTTSLDRTKNLLIQASNGSQSVDSMDAIATELRGLETHFKSLANTSIDGKFLFSGSATDIKPISADGIYNGNDGAINSFLSPGVSKQTNLSGLELFLGEESNVKRKITTNVPQYSLTQKYPDFSDSTIKGTDSIITTESTIRDLMGDIVNEFSDAGPSHFYISGTGSNGDAFSEHITMSGTETVENLLNNIGNAFGNTPSLDLVNVSLNEYGEIVVEDKMSGSSKLDFHMVGAIDFNSVDGNDAANINDSIYQVSGQISNLNGGETNFDAIVNDYSKVANTDLYINNFMQSPYDIDTPVVAFKSMEYTVVGTTNVTDLYNISVNNGDGTTTAYSNGTLANLKTAVDADGAFIVNIVDDKITFEATAQGIASGVSIASGSLTTNNGGISFTENSVNNELAKIDGLIYDQTDFAKDGAKLTSSIPQVLKTDNSFATDSTKLSEVADITKGTLDTADDTLDGTQFNLSGTNIAGSNYQVTINLNSTANGGSTFTTQAPVTSTTTVTQGDGTNEGMDITIAGINITTADGGINVTESNLVKFTDLAQGATLDIGGLMLTVSDAGGMTAAEIANAFDSLANGASGPNPAKGSFSGLLNGWSTGVISNGDEVTFTSAIASADVIDLPVSGSVASNTKTEGNTLLTPTENAAIYAAAINNAGIKDISASFSGTDLVISNSSASAISVTVADAGQSALVDATPIAAGVNTYNIYNTDTPRTTVDADKMTYRQLMDTINMVVTNTLPTTGNSVSDYDTAINSSQYLGGTHLTYDGKLEFEEINSTDTKASIALHDTNAGNFDPTISSSVMTFNTNNALTINDPKTDFFKTLNEVITSVEEHKLYPDGTTGVLRNVGMEDAIEKLDELQSHLRRSHSYIGTTSKALSLSIERTSLLEVSTMTLRSETIDTDFAEASLRLTQLSFNYEAMLSTVGKVSKLSLVNYL